MKATNIKWDVDNKEDLENLPTEIEIPAKIAKDVNIAFEDFEDLEKISDYLSDLTGFCHDGFVLEK